jgi:hemerythrin-like metal-binding protein
MSDPPQPFFRFEKWYLVGIDSLDNQHKQIVTLVGELYQSIIAKATGDAHLGLLTQLVKLTEIHFATEEQILRTRAYPDYLRHKAAHDGLKRNLLEFRGQIAGKQRELTIEYADLMKLWLIDHFVEFDLGYARFFGGENHARE